MTSQTITTKRGDYLCTIILKIIILLKIPEMLHAGAGVASKFFKYSHDIFQIKTQDIVYETRMKRQQMINLMHLSMFIFLL